MATKSRKSAKKSETISFVSPFGFARFPKLNAPDTEGKFADGKFKTQIIFEDGDVEKLRAVFVAAAAKLHPGVEDVKLPLKMFFNKNPETDERDVEAGEGFEAKSKNRPLILDSKKNRLPEGKKVGGGSVIRIGGAIAPYTREIEETIIENGKKRKQEGTEYGLTVYLNSVQVKELKAGGGASDGSEFEEVEGFEYEGGEEGEEFADDATDL